MAVPSPSPSPSPSTTSTRTPPDPPGTPNIPLPYQIITITFLLLSSIKWLLVPSYRSTDFDVHRNWLAITHHLPMSQWYFDDADGTTVHTLDYPPLFALFEAFLSNNPLTRILLGGWLDERCFEILPDVDNAPSDRCVRFQRATVVFVGDLVVFLGAYLASRAACRRRRRRDGKVYNKNSADGNSKGVDGSNNGRYSNHDDDLRTWSTFLLIVTNPGLIILDHVHFQYNGMLLGLLLCSLAFIIRGTHLDVHRRWWRRRTSAQEETTTIIVYSSRRTYELVAAATYAALLAAKHLYLILAPLYLVHLLRHHCFVAVEERRKVVRRGGAGGEKKGASGAIATETSVVTLEFSPSRFASLAAITLLCFVGPFIPFLVLSNGDPVGQMTQIVSRLFPFGRGLVHDYWAANIWALYLFADKIATFVLRKASSIGIVGKVVNIVVPAWLVPFSEPSPATVAAVLLFGLIPALVCAWRDGGSSLRRGGVVALDVGAHDDGGEDESEEKGGSVVSNDGSDGSPSLFFVRAVVFSSLSGFMLAYHVHEKAIMTAIIPLTLLSTTSRDDARLFVRTCAFGIFGLLPLLYRAEELGFKVVLCGTWIFGAVCCLDNVTAAPAGGKGGIKSSQENDGRGFLTLRDKVSFTLLVCVLVFMEIIHPIVFRPTNRLEFLPLMMTSVVCAMGLVGCWIDAGLGIWRRRVTR